MNKEDDWSLEEMEEEETVGKTASIKEDNDPRVELQRSGVSYLATQE
jgi:hypothetical protein